MKVECKEIGKLPGTLVKCYRTSKIGLIINVKDSGTYRYPEIMWFGHTEKIASRGFETIKVYEDEQI